MADNPSRAIINSTRAGGVTLVAKSANSSKKPKTTKVEDPQLKKVLEAFDISWTYAKGSWHDRWQNNNLLYNNNRVKRGYEGITDTFVPLAYSTVETLTSALFGTKPKFEYLPPSDKREQSTDILNALLDYFWDKDQWSLKNITTGRSCYKLGTAIDYYFWDKDHPVRIHIPIRDFFIDPACTSVEDARYMGRRFLITKEQLEEFEIVDFDAEPDENGDYPMKKKYSNLDKVEAGSQGENTDKQEKDMWYGSTLPEPEKGQIEVLEYWTNDEVISIANRSVVIENTENYHKAKARANGVEFPQGLMPFADARDVTDESLFYAKGEIDFIADQQELLNDITNQNIDSITYALNPMYTLDPKYGDQINSVENLPGAVYPFEKDALNPIPRASIPPDAFAERQNIKNEIRETTATNEVIKGVGAEGAKTTATEINAQVAGAGQRINLKVTQLENGYFHRMARIVFEMIKLYVTQPMMVRIVGKDGARWDVFDPKDFQGNYEPRVQLDITIQNKKEQQAVKAMELLAAFRGDPSINQEELNKMVLQRSFDLDPDEVELLMQPQMPMGGVDPMTGQPMMPEQVMGDPMAQGMQPLPDEQLALPAGVPV